MWSKQSPEHVWCPSPASARRPTESEAREMRQFVVLRGVAASIPNEGILINALGLGRHPNSMIRIPPLSIHTPALSVSRLTTISQCRLRCAQKDRVAGMTMGDCLCLHTGSGSQESSQYRSAGRIRRYDASPIAPIKRCIISPISQHVGCS